MSQKLKVQVAICFAIIIVFLSVDTISSRLDASLRLLRCTLDTSCHASIAALIWLGTINIGKRPGIQIGDIDRSTMFRASSLFYIMKSYKEVFISFLCGSIVDVDHFIAASSLSLTDATHLKLRPYGHTILVGCTCSVVVFLLSALFSRWNGGESNPNKKSSDLYRSKRTGLLVFSAYFSHLLRDSVRRGLWLATIPAGMTPGGLQAIPLTTSPMPLWLVFGVYFIMPQINQLILQRWKSLVVYLDYDEDSESRLVEHKLTV